MADNITLITPSGGETGNVVKTDDDGTAHWQYMKVAFGADNTQNIVASTATNPLPVALSDTDNAVLDSIQTAVEGTVTVDWAGTAPPIGAGVEATALRVTLATDSTGVVSVDDGGANLSVDWAGTVPPIGAGTEAAALRVTLATDSTGVVSVDDGGANLSVDWAGTVPPIGAGTEAAALRVTLATDSTGVVSVDDGGANLSVDWAGTVPPIGAGTEAAALRVTLATDSTGVVTVDDGGSSLTVDSGAAFTVQEDGAALTALQLLDDGMLVEDAAAAANPTGMLGMSVRDDEVGSTAIATADNDVQALRSNMFGALKVTSLPDATSEVKYAIINAATSGNNTIQASAGAGTKIRVLSAFLVSAGTVNARFESGADGTALTGQMNLVANSGFTLPLNEYGWFETADDTLLNLELSAGVSVDGCISYVEV